MKRALLALMLIGCTVPDVQPAELESGDEPGEVAKEPTATKTSKDSVAAPVTATTMTTAPPTPVTAPPPVTWTGHLDASPTVAFGGNGFCNYSVVLGDIDVALTLDAQSHVTASNVTATMTESIDDPTCATPKGTLPSSYTYAPADAGAGLAISLTPDASNDPQGTLALDVTTMSEASMHVSLVFHRTDTGNVDLDWTVNAELDVTPN